MLGFAVTKYKVQRATFQITIFDLYTNIKLENKGVYKRF